MTDSIDAPDWQAVACTRYPAAFPQLQSYADLLANEGVEWGLIGPREVPRLWERHILNCAAVSDPAAGQVPLGATVVDVGSGAGLPGLVWALTRPDIQVTLVEPLQRRVNFLELAVERLNIAEQVSIHRGRAEDAVGVVTGSVVTARAVAPLPKLLRWLAPLTDTGGCIVAMKGSSAADEIEGARKELKAAGAGSAEVILCGADWLDQATTVVRIPIVGKKSASRRPKH